MVETCRLTMYGVNLALTYDWSKGAYDKYSRHVARMASGVRESTKKMYRTNLFHL